MVLLPYRRKSRLWAWFKTNKLSKFAPRMVFSKRHSALIVTEDHDCLGGSRAGVELIQEASKQNGFLGSLRLADVFGLTSGKRYCGLSLG